MTALAIIIALAGLFIGPWVNGYLGLFLMLGGMTLAIYREKNQAGNQITRPNSADVKLG